MVLFYLEHYLVRRLTTCKLEDRLGYRQSVWSSLCCLLAGAIGILHPFDIAGFPDRMLIAAAIFGEIVFVWNVIRAFTRDEVVAIFPSSPSRRRVERGGDNFGWPKSPVMQFGIAAAGFAVGGFVSIVANTPSFKDPVPLGGRMRLVRFGWLALTAAIPFALYAGLYRWMIDNYRIHFDDSLNRVHFAVTIVGVILVIMEWEQSVMFRDTAPSRSRTARSNRRTGRDCLRDQCLPWPSTKARNAPWEFVKALNLRGICPHGHACHFGASLRRGGVFYRPRGRKRRLLEDHGGEELDHQPEKRVANGTDGDGPSHSHIEEIGENRSHHQPHEDAVPRPMQFRAQRRRSQNPSPCDSAISTPKRQP